MSTWPHLPDQTPPDRPSSWTPPPHYPGFAFNEQLAPEVSAVPLSHYLWILRRHLWKMAAFVAICVLATFVMYSRQKPIYQSTVTVDVNHQTPSEVVGAGSNKDGSDDDEDEFLATQMKLI